MVTRTLPPLSPEQLHEVARNVVRAGDEIGVQWIRSNLTADGRHSFCEYDAPDEQAIREHSRISGIPFDNIAPLGVELEPSWAT
jgi:hypothetical protein